MTYLHRMALAAAMASLGMEGPPITRDPEPRRLPLDPLPPREHFESERPISKRRKRRLHGKARGERG